MNPAKFWIVWGPTQGAPKMRHTSIDAAHKEADRLASHYGCVFIVLESVGEYKKTATTYSPHGKREGV